jgi:hypothetical protein
VVSNQAFQMKIRPRNYLDIVIEEQEIPSNLDDADADRRCDLTYPVPSGFVCTIQLDGDNHLGFIGFRGLVPNSVRNNGAMDNVVEVIAP